MKINKQQHPLFVTAQEDKAAQQESPSDLHYTPNPCRSVCSFPSSAEQLYPISHLFLEFQHKQPFGRHRSRNTQASVRISGV